jgi:hypothetical protein
MGRVRRISCRVSEAPDPLIPNPRNAKQRKEAKVRQAFGSPFIMHQPIAQPVRRRFMAMEPNYFRAFHAPSIAIDTGNSAN